METKTCTRCGLKKLLTEFNFKNKASGKRLAMCRECQRARERELYKMSYREKNKDKYRENRKKYKTKIRLIVLNAKSCGCAICGEKETCCLDFHHLRDKEFTISNVADMSVDRLEKELQKCIVLCANCHRKVHAGIITLNLEMNRTGQPIQ